ncbi:MAG: endopeptidase [Verrucomicrobiota bacterium]
MIRTMRWLRLCFLQVVLAAAAPAQEPTSIPLSPPITNPANTPPLPAAPPPGSSLTATPEATVTPAPVSKPAFDPEAATREWLASIPADQKLKSNAYFEGGYWLMLWNFLLSSAIAFLLLTSRISARIRDFAERTTRFKSIQVLIYAMPYIILSAALSFPLTVYERYFREHQYGMATQMFAPWFMEQLKGLLIALILGPLFLMILYAVLRAAPRTWWLWATAVVVAGSLFFSFIFPVFIEPIFNKYTPLTDSTIQDPILQLARANEIPVTKVFVVDASRQTKRVSANVAGFLNTTRIALNDNLLNQCTLPEIRAVMAHEMGHYVLNHIVKLTFYSALSFLIGFALTKALFNMLVRKYGSRWGVRGIGDPAGLPLIGLIVGAYFFLITPLSNTSSRVVEREADAFGINAAREPDGMAKIALKLGIYRKMEPSALEEFVFFDHPSGRSRIRMAMDWKAANPPCGSFDPTVGKPK